MELCSLIEIDRSHELAPAHDDHNEGTFDRILNENQQQPNNQLPAMPQEAPDAMRRQLSIDNLGSNRQQIENLDDCYLVR